VTRPEKVYEFGPYRFDASQLLFRNGQLIALPPKATQTLRILVENHGRLVEKDDLMKEVWPDTFVEESNLTLQISALRKVLQEESGNGSYIDTVPRRGYRFVAKVIERPELQPLIQQSLPPRAAARRRWFVVVVVSMCTAAALVLALRIKRQKPTASTGDIRSLAVLPLQNLSGDSAQEYLADGLTEELVTDLAQFHSLRVISRTSTMRYKQTQKSLPEIARELHVQGIVEGSVLRSGERVRIHVQLIRARDDVHIWANSYEGDPDDLLGLQRAAAQAVVHEIQVRLSPEEQERLNTVRLVNASAHEAYLKGRYVFNERTPESTAKSVAFFQEAVAKDPQYAAAYLALGEAYAVLAANTIAAPEDVVPKAQQAEHRALDLDPGQGEAYAALAHLAFFYDRDLPAAESGFRRAIELSPNDAIAHHWYGILLIGEKRFDEAEHEFHSALETDPLSLVTAAGLANVYFYAGRYDQTITQAKEILEMNPNFPMAHDLIGMADEQKSMYDDAESEFRKYSDLGGGGDAKMHLAHLYAVMGRRSQARKLLGEMERPPKGEFASPYDIASIYAALGERATALDWMERAYRVHAAMIAFAGVDPLLNPLRSEPRFEALLHRAGLRY
jgi:TolB-like protein/DNA-binding winged helix-turn-helix (wHTH) protein/Tfp pilus assembly protein PilF